jgi:phage shock protein A
MSSKPSIEEEMKKLQKQFGGVVQLVKTLKTSVEALDKKIDEREDK